MNFEGFTQNGCYGNQPQPFEVVFHSIDANTSCYFTKQDLTRVPNKNIVQVSVLFCDMNLSFGS